MCRTNARDEGLHQWTEWTSRLPSSWWDQSVWMLEELPVCSQRREELWGSAELDSEYLVPQMWLGQHHTGFQWSDGAGKMSGGLQWLWISVENPQFIFWRFLIFWQAVGSTGAKKYCYWQNSLPVKPAILWVLNTAKLSFWKYTVFVCCEPFIMLHGHF